MRQKTFNLFETIVCKIFNSNEKKRIAKVYRRFCIFGFKNCGNYIYTAQDLKDENWESQIKDT